jgi:hypothetical protein
MQVPPIPSAKDSRLVALLCAYSPGSGPGWLLVSHRGAVMFKKFVLAGFTFVVLVGVSLSDEMRVFITKIEGDNVTFAKNEGKGKKGDPMTLPVAKDLKVNKGNFNKDTKKIEAGDAIDGGLKAEVFTKIDPEKGMQVTIVTDADNKKITQIIVGGKKGKGK